MEDRALDIATHTTEEHLSQLRLDVTSLDYYSSDLDERVHIDLTQLSNAVLHRQTTYSHEDVLVDVVILREELKSDVVSNYIQNWQHDGGLFSDPNGDCWHKGRQVIVGDL